MGWVGPRLELRVQCDTAFVVIKEDVLFLAVGALLEPHIIPAARATGFLNTGDMQIDSRRHRGVP